MCPFTVLLCQLLVALKLPTCPNPQKEATVGSARPVPVRNQSRLTQLQGRPGPAAPTRSPAFHLQSVTYDLEENSPDQWFSATNQSHPEGLREPRALDPPQSFGCRRSVAGLGKVHLQDPGDTTLQARGPHGEPLAETPSRPSVNLGLKPGPVRKQMNTTRCGSD